MTDTTPTNTPQRIAAPFDELALGLYHGCGIRDATVACWGRNRAGALGNGQQARRAILAGDGQSDGALQLV